MHRLPLFPLHSVLFPGAPIFLHIFEERYKEMIHHCMREELEFGVVLIEEGQEALGPLARPHLCGTTARILKIEHLAEGRMNLTALGSRRFRIGELDHHGAAYLQGEVEISDLLPGNDNENRRGRALLPLFDDYLRLLAKNEEIEIDFSRLPTDARTLCYTGAYLLQVPQVQKQAMLETDTVDALLDDLEATYRKQIEILKLVQEQGENPTDESGFSLN